MATGSSRGQHDRTMLALIRALARPNARTAWTGTGLQRVLVVTVTDGPAPRTVARIGAAIAREAISRGLLAESEKSPGQPIGATSAGLAWLRRQLAADDPFLAQHRTMRRVVEKTESGKRARNTTWVNDAESPLTWLRHRKDRNGKPMLDDAQYEAGERLRRDYTFAALEPRVTANWSTMAPSDRMPRSGASNGALKDDVIAAKARVAGALGAIGPELGRILVDICCLLKGIETAESEQGLPQRSGKVVLQLALTALARHYGLLSRTVPRCGPSEVLHWGQSDYRPALK